MEQQKGYDAAISLENSSHALPSNAHDSNSGMQQHHHKQPSRDLSHDSFSPPPVSDSSFSSTVIVDIDAIELDKENIQPLRQGRSAQTLARLFATQHEDRAQQQAVMHGRFQEELAHIDDLDDPMDVYSRYVKWMIENYPQSAGQGHDSQLSPILERALADYKDDPRYRNDPRFVKLLIIYSEQITNAVDIFSFMESNGIGSEISMFYEELADLLESRDDASGGSQRRVLGVKVSGTHSVHSNTGIQGYVPIEWERPISSTTAPTARGTASSGQSRPGTKLQVYSDQASQSPVSKPKATPKNSISQPSTSWMDFGAEKVRRKENSREVTSWRGATLSSEDTVPRRVHPKLEVYRDPEVVSPPKDAEKFASRTSGEENKTPLPLAHIPTTRTPTARIILDVHRPHSPHQSFMKQLQAESTHTYDVQKRPVTTNAVGKPERLMIDLSDIYVDGEEFSVEEIRARNPHYYWHATSNTMHSSSSKNNEPSRSPPPPPAAGSSTKHHRHDLESGQTAGRPPKKKAQPGNERDPPLALYTAQAPLLSVRELLPQSPGEEERQHFGSQRRLTASPTMNTKYASEEMNKIFSDRSRTRRSMDSQWSVEDTQDVGRNELDNFTMAYSIPSLPLALPPFPHGFLDYDVVNEFEDDDDRDGRTELFVRRLENGFSSTITQDIAALKRLHAEESTLGDTTQSSQGNRLSLLGGKWNSSRFDPFKTQESDITIAIRQMTQKQQQQQQQHDVEGDGGTQNGHLRPSLDRTSIGSFSSAQRRYGNGEESHPSVRHADQEYEESPFTMFKEGTGNTDAVPMLEDEPPPAHLDKDEPYTLSPNFNPALQIVKILERIFSFLDELALRQTVILVRRQWLQVNQGHLLREVHWSNGWSAVTLDKALSKVPEAGRFCHICSGRFDEHENLLGRPEQQLSRQAPDKKHERFRKTKRPHICFSGPLRYLLELWNIIILQDYVSRARFRTTLINLKNRYFSGSAIGFDQVLTCCLLLEEFHGDKNGILKMEGRWVPIGHDRLQPFRLKSLVLRNTKLQQSELEDLLAFSSRLTEFKLIQLSPCTHMDSIYGLYIWP
ncbi:hypothetical protein BGW39_006569 [Mortierella sp. 14UC]|nr:hypothetical protein BGW39_006569 [Mortierella sp. 14UC]